MQNKKKILFILHLPPPVHGSSVVGSYIKDSALINNTFNSKYINLGTSKSIDEIGKKGLGKFVIYIKIILNVIKQLIVFKPDLVYLAMTAKGVAFYKDMVMVFLAKLFGVQLVIHFHNKGVSHNQNKTLDNFLYKLVFKNTRVILLSKYLYPDIKKYVNETDVYYCPNGIPSIVNGDLEKSINQIPQILFLSNLIESKGVSVLLAACKILKENGILFNCTYVGGEGDISKEELNQNIVQLNLSEEIHYAGKKYGIDKAHVFLKTDIFAFPTYYHNETFGLVLVEAMQFSVPVISTFEGGIPDVVEDEKTGFLVPQKDAVSLAEKLELLIKNPVLRKEMGELGRKKYEAEFTLGTFEKRFTSILKELVQRNC